MKIKPLRNLIVVRKLAPATKAGGIYLAENVVGRFVKFEVMEVNKHQEDLKEIKVGKVYWGDPIEDDIPGTDLAFITSDRLHGEIISDKLHGEIKDA